MKKAIIISIISALLVGSLLFYFLHLDTIGLVYLEDKSDIKYFSSHSDVYLAVSNSGDCFVGGTDVSGKANYGVENVRKYNNTFNANLFDAEYVRIYDKKDASSVKLTQYGGAIITQNNDVYVFFNNNEAYRTPTYLCSGYVSAIVGKDSRVYLLTEKGVVEYISINNPDKHQFIGDNIKKINYAEKDGSCSIFALTNDNKLYILGADMQIQNSTDYLSNITDFDVLVPDKVLAPYKNICIFSFVNTNGDAYMLAEDNDLSYNSFSDDSLYIKTGENVQYVSVYNSGESGVTMLDDKGDLSIYGSDFHSPRDNGEFTGDVVFEDVKASFGGDGVLTILKNNGDFYHYGNQLDTTVEESITPYD